MSDLSTVRILDASEVDPELTLDMGEVSEDLVILKWKSHRESLLGGFPSLLNIEKFVDVTLMCEGKVLSCHKMILSSCSPYFDVLLSSAPCSHSFVLLTDLRFWEIQAIVDFMYKGEVSIEQHNVTRLLEVANKLHVKGLCASNIKTEDVSEEDSVLDDTSSHEDQESPSKRRRKRRKLTHDEVAVVPKENQSTDVVVVAATQRVNTNHKEKMNQREKFDEDQITSSVSKNIVGLDCKREEIARIQEENTELKRRLLEEIPAMMKKMNDFLNNRTLVNMGSVSDGQGHQGVGKVEILPGTGVCVDIETWLSAKASKTPGHFVGRLLVSLFDKETLLNSNLKGGASKLSPNAEKKKRLDEVKISALKGAMQTLFPDVKESQFGVFVNQKLTNFRTAEKKITSN